MFAPPVKAVKTKTAPLPVQTVLPNRNTGLDRNSRSGKPMIRLSGTRTASPEQVLGAPAVPLAAVAQFSRGYASRSLPAKPTGARSLSGIAPTRATDVLQSPGKPLDAESRAFSNHALDPISVLCVSMPIGKPRRERAPCGPVRTLSGITSSSGPVNTRRQHQPAGDSRARIGACGQQASGAAVLQRAPAGSDEDEIEMPEDYVGKPRGSMRLGGKAPAEITGPKPIGLLSMNYSGPDVCGGGPCFTDDDIYRPSNEARSRIDEANKKAADASVAAKPVNEAEQKAAIASERAKFRARHADHGKGRLDNIDAALSKVNEHNLNLTIAFYSYYATNKLGDDPDKGDMATTKNGGTEVLKSLLELAPERDNLATSDAVSLLGSTLMHEYVHAFQGSEVNGPKEDKAYGAEYALSWRMKDKKRMAKIDELYSSEAWDAQKRRRTSTQTMEALYDIIDKGQSGYKALKGVTAARARELMVEYMSTGDPKAYGYQLRNLIREISR